MRWPWHRASRKERLVVSWSGQVLAYVLVTGAGNQFTVLRCGVEQQGADSHEAFVRRVAQLGLGGLCTNVMLRPEQYQLLQIEAPAVAPEELRSAARYQIKDMVDVHLDDLTTDVVSVGDGQGRSASQLFVVAAHNAVVRDAMALAHALQWELAVIDVQDMAQRNLQSLEEPERASCALIVGKGRQALLTISAGSELYYSRRLDVPEGFLDMGWRASATVQQAPVDAYTPVEEYVPGYAAVGYEGDFSHAVSAAPGPALTDMDRAQRLVVEVQRTIDLWERTWPQLALAGIKVFAGERSEELAQWLSRDMGQSVSVLKTGSVFGGLDTVSHSDMTMCLPLLGLLLRTEARKA